MPGVLTMVAIGLLCGAFLGLRCRVAILVPVHALASLAVAVLATAGDGSTGHLLVSALAWSLGCQGGYLAGAVARPAKPPARRPTRPARRAPS